MKIDVSPKLKKMIYRKQKTIIVVLAILVLSIVGFAVYQVVVIQDDQTVISGNSEKLNSLNINFDKKFLEELNNKKSPSKVNEVGGRNPFQSF